MPSDHLSLCHPLLLLPSILPNIRVFPNESVVHIRWPKDWTFSFLINPSNEYSELISFRIDWFDLLAVQGTQESSPAPQFKRINSSVLSLLYGLAFTSINDCFLDGSESKESACNAGDPSSIPGSGRSLGEGNDSPV